MWGLWLCISNRFPDDSAAGPETTRRETMSKKIKCGYRTQLSSTVVTHGLCSNGREGLILILFSSFEVIKTRKYDQNNIWILWQKPLVCTDFIAHSCPSCCEYGFYFFLTQEVDYYAMQNFINMGFLFASSLFFFFHF